MERPISEIKAYLRSKTCRDNRFIRDVTANPWTYGGYWAVTNGHMLWMVKDGSTENTYPKPDAIGEDLPKWFTANDWTGKVNINEIREMLKKAESIKSYPTMQCPECEGRKTIHCDCCYHENDCRECDGRGEVNRSGGEPFWQVADGQKIMIGEYVFDAGLMNEFVKNCDTIGISNMKVLFLRGVLLLEQGIYRYLQMNQMDTNRAVLGKISV